MIGTPEVGFATVLSTESRGWSPEELSERLISKIIKVSEEAPEPIRLQAEAFRERIQRLCLIYLRQAASSDRTTVYNRLREAGFPDAAEAMRRL